MLTRITPAEVILALRPLLQNTPRSPRTEKTPKAILTAEDVVTYLNDVYERAEWPVCPECKREWNALTHEGICIGCVDGRQADATRQVKAGEYLAKTIGRYGIERYRFDAFDITHENNLAHQRMRDFNHERNNLFVWGPCGTGKTHLAGAVMKDCCAKSVDVKWCNPMYLARLLRSRFPSEEEGIIEDLVNRQVLVIDDLGVGRDTDVTLRLLYEIVDKRRARAMNGLIVTSNLSLDDLAKNYRDDRIASRIAGLCEIIEIGGIDRRLTKK